MQATPGKGWLVLAGTLIIAIQLTPSNAQQESPPQAPAPADPWAILDVARGRAPREAFPIPGIDPGATITEVTMDDGASPVIVKDELWATFEAAYRGYLKRLGDADHDAVVRRVARLEVDTLDEQPERRLDRLAREELTVAKEVAARDPEALVPIFQLHHDLYLEHREPRQAYLLLHSVLMVQALAELYVHEAHSRGAEITAARLLTSLGGHLQAGRQPTSIRLFERALELDPKNEAALLGMAAHYEKKGGPIEEVVRYMRLLLEAYPEHREGRLRLAVNLLRLGDDKEAATLLAGLLDEPVGDWVQRLAAQELARYEARQGRLDDAIAVLEKAVEVSSDDQKLHIQLAFLYDKNRQSWNANRLAERASRKEPATESPRGRYNKWPSAALRTSREELRKLAESRVALLARYAGGRGERMEVQQ